MISIKKIKEFLDENNVHYEYVGKDNCEVEYFCPLNALKDNSIIWIKNANSYDISIFNKFNNIIVVCNARDTSEAANVNYLFVDNPHPIYFSIIRKFFTDDKEIKYEIAANSVVESKNIGKHVKIGHFCYIGKDVIIKDNVTIGNNVSIDGKVVIGEGTIIYSGVVIGMDGYGFYDDIEYNHRRVPHLGGVIIGKNVEIGANTCIAKGCLGDTIIGDDVKIDNLCHIAHNVRIGNRSRIIALSMLAGSSVIGENAWVAPCSSIKNQVKVGDNSFIGMGAVVIKDVEDNTSVSGFPARIIKTNNDV